MANTSGLEMRFKVKSLYENKVIAYKETRLSKKTRILYLLKVSSYYNHGFGHAYHLHLKKDSYILIGPHVQRTISN
jgi:hypothetical protein